MTRRTRDKAAHERQRFAVFERDGWRCQHCGSRDNLHLHHQRFRSHGGPDSDENLIVLCAECHRAIHTGTN
jgi:5-methylcytosine-specific restriction endonuclease McrA